MSNDFDPAEYSGIPNRVERVLSSTYRPAGYEVIDVKMILKPPGLTADVADFWGGYEIQFKLVEQTVGLTHLWWTV